MDRLTDEQPNVSLHVFGVGRGVDKVILRAAMHAPHHVR